MKIIIMGYSGSGKSTLCRRLANQYGVPSLHLDQVQFLPHWQVRDQSAKINIVKDFMQQHPEGWVMDGNYTSLCLDQRLEEADQIVLLLFNRLNCLWRCTRRYRMYHGTTRPDMTADCPEKLDGEFIRWILWDGRTQKKRREYQTLAQKYPNKVIILKNQHELDTYLAESKM